MTPSNLDLASELWAMSQGSNPIDVATSAIAAELDAFAERIRADAIAEYAAMTEKGAKAWADVPDATAWVDELRGNAPVQPVALPAGMPEPAAWRYSASNGVFRYRGKRPGFDAEYQILKPEALYTVAQVQAMLAAAPSGPMRVPLLARALAEWNEEDGYAAWWATTNCGWASEPAWIGTPLSSDWPGYHTHWTPHPEIPCDPSITAAQKGGQHADR